LMASQILEVGALMVTLLVIVLISGSNSDDSDVLLSLH